MAIARDSSLQLMGVTQPRLAPPLPLVSLVDEFTAAALEQKIELMPWQSLAARYMVATNGEDWLNREVCIAVSRQNGKTSLLLPRILMGLRRGEHILHTAQNRTLPRHVFMLITHALRDDEVAFIRYANGMEEISMLSGGSYKIVAPQRGARGLSADTLIFDEVREFEDFDMIAAATPTLTASRNPQTIYLSNAGSDKSVVLNDLKRRAEEGDELAYLEWSAAPERAIDDPQGWSEANPALGHTLRTSTLEEAYRILPTAVFETEHLCRWVASMQPRLVAQVAWDQCRGTLEKPDRPVLGFNMDASGKRVSVLMAWRQTDGKIALRELIEGVGDPIDMDRLGADLKARASEQRIRQAAFASWTDANLAKFLDFAKPLDGKEFANASESFARLVISGQLVWDDAFHVGEDLAWTSRRPHDSGAWQAVPASPDHSVTAVLAAIRAVQLAFAPRPPTPRIG